MFPLKNYKYTIPTDADLGAFGVTRKFDMHTGVDLYCKHGDNVYAIEDGIVVNVENFTGEIADSPWWNNTKAVLIKGASGVILYGEIDPVVKTGDTISEGQVVGTVLTVLKKDKGKTPCSMLHMELHDHSSTESAWWKLNEDKPEKLRDITERLHAELMLT